MNVLMKITQQAVIEEKLKSISDDIQKSVDYAEGLICTLENVKDIKKQRTILRNKFNELEKQRKEIKSEYQAPYLHFESVYNDLIGNKYKLADMKLKSKIDEIETKLKQEKENNLRNYFNEYCSSEDIDFVRFEQVNLNINLSSTEKSLREKIKEFIDKVKNDIELIQHEEYFAEIMIEYTKHLNVSRAIIEVKERHKKLSEIVNGADKNVQNVQNDTNEQRKEETLKAPETIYTMTFSVKGSKSQLAKLKQYLVDNNLI